MPIPSCLPVHSSNHGGKKRRRRRTRRKRRRGRRGGINVTARVQLLVSLSADTRTLTAVPQRAPASISMSTMQKTNTPPPRLTTHTLLFFSSNTHAHTLVVGRASFLATLQLPCSVYGLKRRWVKKPKCNRDVEMHLLTQGLPPATACIPFYPLPPPEYLCQMPSCLPSSIICSPIIKLLSNIIAVKYNYCQ